MAYKNQKLNHIYDESETEKKGKPHNQQTLTTI